MASSMGTREMASAAGTATDETGELISSAKVEGTPVYNLGGEKLGTVEAGPGSEPDHLPGAPTNPGVRR